jgi:hypothetical protein
VAPSSARMPKGKLTGNTVRTYSQWGTKHKLKYRHYFQEYWEDLPSVGGISELLNLNLSHNRT